jgi:REase_DpnII-MboI
MANIRIPRAVCAAVQDILVGSHAALDALFESSGCPGPPPSLSHPTKWKTWLFEAGMDENVDSLLVLGNLLEEFMDLPPDPEEYRDLHRSELSFEDFENPLQHYERRKQRLVNILEENGFRYYRGGRVLPIGEVPLAPVVASSGPTATGEAAKPTTVEALLETLIRGLPRAMHPLTHRRKGATALSFGVEYDIQDLLHSQLRPWVADIRAEEFTPSYAGSSTRMDFLLPKHRLVVETKRVRDKAHAKTIGNELIVDIEHYRNHPDCDRLWCIIYDPGRFIENPSGLISDLEGHRDKGGKSVQVRVFIVV